MNAMGFAAIIHGANGMMWFHYDGELSDPKKSYSGIFRTKDDWDADYDTMVYILLDEPHLTFKEMMYWYKYDFITQDEAKLASIFMIAQQDALDCLEQDEQMADDIVFESKKDTKVRKAV